VPFAIDLSEGIPVGDEVYAIGTPFDVELGATLTKGIISGRRKDGNRTLIQSDVSISPGNSGGALVDAQGTLIGIVNQKIFGMGVEGIGFAIPAHYLEDALGLKWSEVK
jgi:serine protease Do